MHIHRSHAETGRVLRNEKHGGQMQIHAGSQVEVVLVHKQGHSLHAGRPPKHEMRPAHHPSSDQALIVTTPANPTDLKKAKSRQNKQIVKREIKPLRNV